MADPYAAALVELYAKKREIDQTIATLEAMQRGWGYHTAPEEGQITTASTAPPRQAALHDAVHTVLDEHGEPIHLRDIVSALEERNYEIGGANKHQAVRGILSRGKATGAFANPKRGWWTIKKPSDVDPIEPAPPGSRPVSAFLDPSYRA